MNTTTVIDPLVERMHALATSLYYDEETAHCEADDLLCKVVVALATEAGDPALKAKAQQMVADFDALDKWYA